MLACRNFLQGMKFGEHSKTIRISFGNSHSGFFLRPIQAFYSVKHGILIIPEDCADSIMGVLALSLVGFPIFRYKIPLTKNRFLSNVLR